MTIIDTTTVSAFLTVIAFAVVAVAVTLGLVVRQWWAARPAAPARVAQAATYRPRLAG